MLGEQPSNLLGLSEKTQKVEVYQLAHNRCAKCN